MTSFHPGDEIRTPSLGKERCSSSASSRALANRPLPSSKLSITLTAGPKGSHTSGSDLLKNASVGVPSMAARWVTPLSCPI